MKIRTEGLKGFNHRFNEYKKSVKKCDNCKNLYWKKCNKHTKALKNITERFDNSKKFFKRQRNQFVKFCLICRNPYTTGSITNYRCLACKFDFFSEQKVTKFEMVDNE